MKRSRFHRSGRNPFRDFNFMADTVSKKKRSEIMRLVKSKGSKMELAVRKILDKRKLRYKKNVRGLPGTPDIAFPDKKLVVFLDSCFWHGCRWHGSIPTSNRKFWLKKIQDNKKRDRATNLKYKRMSWKVFRFWEHDLKKKGFKFDGKKIKYGHKK